MRESSGDKALHRALLAAVVFVLPLVAACAPAPASTPTPTTRPAATAAVTRPAATAAATRPAATAAATRPATAAAPATAPPTRAPATAAATATRPAAGVTPSITAAVETAARAFLAGRVNIPAGTFELVSLERVEWPDSCLGVTTSGEMCAQVITPGYRVVLRAAGTQYVVHTDAQGRSFRMAQ